MVDPELLSVLCCPETRQSLRPAGAELLTDLNQRVAAGSLRNRGGQVVSERLDDGLVRADGKFLYPVRNHIPVMLVEAAIPLG